MIPANVIRKIKTPCFVVDEKKLEDNLSLLKYVKERTGAKILLAFKAFAMWNMAPLVMKYLDGVCAGSLYEARLGREEFCKEAEKEVHTYSPAFRDEEIEDAIKYSDHITFNSLSQWRRFKPFIEKAKKAKKKIQVGLRINPEYGEAENSYYNPCSPGSRFGVLLDNLKATKVIGPDLEGITGLHFHALCQRGSDAFERVLNRVDPAFHEFIEKMSWMNFGGGHLITRESYNLERLNKTIGDFSKKYPNIKKIYLEPGEAVAYDAGVLVTSVLDIIENKGRIAILDFSTEAHLNDKAVVDFRQDIAGAIYGEPCGKCKWEYRLASTTCAAGDVLGEYSFSRSLSVGDKIVLLNMGGYTMVKTSAFCGVKRPSIAIYRPGEDDIEVVREFGYEDYRDGLGGKKDEKANI